MSKYNYYLSGWITHLASCTTTKADIWIRGLNRFDPAYNAAYLTNIASLQLRDSSEEQARVDLTQLQCSRFDWHCILTSMHHCQGRHMDQRLKSRQLRGTSQSWFDPATVQSICPTLHPYNSETTQRNKPKSIWPSYNAVDLTNIASLQLPKFVNQPFAWLMAIGQAKVDLTQLTMQPIWPTLHPYNSETAQRNKPESIWPSYNAVDLTNIASLQLPKFVNQPLAWLMALDKPKSIRLSYNVIDSTNIVSWRFKEEAPCGCKLVSRHQRLFVHSHATILRHYNHCVFGWYVWTPVRFSLPGITRVDRHRWTSNNPNVSRIDKPVCMWDR